MRTFGSLWDINIYLRVVDIEDSESEFVVDALGVHYFGYPSLSSFCLLLSFISIENILI